ncbi:MAG TPA: HipA domain-containing protein [Terriglobales bacterium]|nr:HipA domain-containing protein [Terriglobales bacterium]
MQLTRQKRPPEETNRAMAFDPKTLNALAVNLHHRRIGVINRFGGDRHLFSFEQNYIDDENRPTLSLSFKGQAGGLVIPTRAVHARLPVFFSNLLPEEHFRDYLAVRAGVKPHREFFLLAVLGADLPGGLRVEPMELAAQAPPHNAEAARAERMPETALRFSLAGVQLKFSAVMEASGGLTIPAGGTGGSWIVKLPSARFPAVPENEFTMMALARAVGIEVPRTELIDIRDIHGLPADTGSMQGKALAVQRFDRGTKGSQTIHMEDFAQVFGLYPEDKYHHRSYANIAAVLWAETGEAGTYEFFRRLVLSVLIGNADMHLKNWSLLYPDRRTPVLSPAYDFVATLPYLPNDGLALSFGGSRSLSEITTDQVRRFADAARLPASPLWPMVTDIADRAVGAWAKLPEKDLLQEDMRKAIGNQIHKVTKIVRRSVSS